MRLGTRRKPWHEYTTAEIDAAVERQQERALVRYEAEMDRRDFEQEYCRIHRCPADDCECQR